MMDVTVLRVGHRLCRDARISTHVALTARALGAKKIVYDAEASEVRESVEGVVSQWGGDFQVEYAEKPLKYVREFDGIKVHLTMYGLGLNEKIGELLNLEGNLLVIIGGGKVPADMYHIVDYNISVGLQPHSEVAALAVFLDRLFSGKSIDAGYENANVSVVPQKAGKKVISA
jgi:tRNA (cytidine56-2'-O)-methyltransferase